MCQSSSSSSSPLHIPYPRSAELFRVADAVNVSRPRHVFPSEAPGDISKRTRNVSFSLHGIILLFYTVWHTVCALLGKGESCGLVANTPLLSRARFIHRSAFFGFVFRYLLRELLQQNQPLLLHPPTRHGGQFGGPYAARTRNIHQCSL